MNLAGIITAGRGRAGHWRVTPAEFEVGSGELDSCALWHYGTVMAVWRPRDARVLYLSTGWGSVSDQGGMNTLFKILGGAFLDDSVSWQRWVYPPYAYRPPFYYRRAGGAHFVILDCRYSLHPTRYGAFQPMLATEAS